MADIEKIKELGAEIQLKWKEISKLSSEINENLNNDNDFIFTSEYNQLNKEKVNLENELSLLKATRYNLFHEYSLTLNGSFINTNGTVAPDYYFTDKIVCPIDCDLGDERNLDNNESSHKALIKLIQDKFSSYFKGGQFNIVNIFQHR